MSPQLSNWEKQGEYIQFGFYDLRVFTIQIGDKTASADKTLLLLHGFPESSYSYHAVLDGLKESFDRIILFDMPGYGLSDKPTEHYTYSLFEQADCALAVWKHFGVKGGHMLSHDMGDSVATELVARHVQGNLPSWFSDGLQSVTFTNGSMVLSLAKLRITQKLLLTNVGRYVNKITTYKVFHQQVNSAHGNDNLSREDIDRLWEANTLQNGHRKTYLTIKYLNDRKRFETTRWLPALSKLDIPIHLCWGDKDAVARVEMSHYLKKEICPSAELTIMKGLGHFCQLGSPKQWVDSVLSYYQS